jgi:hypothetical protein
MFAPHYKELASNMQSLVHDLDVHAPTNGFLGGNSFLNSSDRTTGSEIMVLCYFKTHRDLQALAHGPHHRKSWDWWNDLSRQKKVGHMSICHEVYCAEKGAWEGIYVNHFPSFFMGTKHWVTDGEKGEWKSPRVEGKGRFRSAMGRMGRSEGEDNEGYGEEPYIDV